MTDDPDNKIVSLVPRAARAEPAPDDFGLGRTTQSFERQRRGTMAMGPLSDELLKLRPERFFHEKHGWWNVEYRQVDTPQGGEIRAFLIDGLIFGLDEWIAS